MKEVWSKSWKKVLIWACGFASIVAFAVVGGYAIVKEDEEVKRSAKNCFIVTLIFLAVNALVSILSGISGFASSAGFNTFLRWLNFILLFVKIAVYAAALPFDLTHGVATVVFLLALYAPWRRKLDRILTKYQLGG